MNKEEFKALYDAYNAPAFDEKAWQTSMDNWNKQLEKWKTYDGSIVDGPELKDWVKENTNDMDYLPYFLETGEKFFGHAKPGTMQGCMIYKIQNDKNNNERVGKIYDGYDKIDKDNIEDEKLKEHYNNNIKPLLKDIVNAEDLESVFNLENKTKYNNFKGKQILRKITILMSLTEDCKYKHEFMWIFSDDVVAILAKILGHKITDKKAFFKNNNAVYKRAKDWTGTDEAKRDKGYYYKLYNFLWDLSISDAVEFSNFNGVNVIFNGAPGTGKTYGVNQAITKLQFKNSEIYRDKKYIQFHPSYTYQDFIEGIKPMGIMDGNLNLQVVNGSFKDFCIYVKKENEKYYNTLKEEPTPENPAAFEGWPHYYFVVDEINRGDLSNIFGETFTLLERDYRDYDFSGNYTEKNVNLVSTALSSLIARTDNNEELCYKKIGDEVLFGIPFNIHFIGIMNDVDKSIDSFDLALRRRFKWIPKYCNYDVIENELKEYSNIEDYIEKCKALNNFICQDEDGLRLGKSYEIGHAFFLKIRETGGTKKITDDKKKSVFENYIEGTLKEYIRQVRDENEIDSVIKEAKKKFGVK